MVSTSQDPLMLTVGTFAELLAVGPATIRRWNAAGKVPAPIRIGGTVRWRADEVKAWVGAGCPARRTWNIIRDQKPERG